MHVRRLALTQFSNKVDTRVICDCAQQGYSIIGRSPSPLWPYFPMKAGCFWWFVNSLLKAACVPLIIIGNRTGLGVSTLHCPSLKCLILWTQRLSSQPRQVVLNANNRKPDCVLKHSRSIKSYHFTCHCHCLSMKSYQMQVGNNLKKRKMRKTEILWFLFQYVSKFEI